MFDVRYRYSTASRTADAFNFTIASRCVVDRAGTMPRGRHGVEHVTQWPGEPAVGADGRSYKRRRRRRTLLQIMSSSHHAERRARSSAPDASLGWLDVITYKYIRVAGR